jgi:aminoglycoside phosphotransferase
MLRNGMTLSNAERQARWRARRAAEDDALRSAIASYYRTSAIFFEELKAENAHLKAEIDRLKEALAKAQRLTASKLVHREEQSDQRPLIPSAINGQDKRVDADRSGSLPD